MCGRVRSCRIREILRTKSSNGEVIKPEFLARGFVWVDSVLSCCTFVIRHLGWCECFGHDVMLRSCLGRVRMEWGGVTISYSRHRCHLDVDTCLAWCIRCVCNLVLLVYSCFSWDKYRGQNFIEERLVQLSFVWSGSGSGGGGLGGPCLVCSFRTGGVRGTLWSFMLSLGLYVR